MPGNRLLIFILSVAFFASSTSALDDHALWQTVEWEPGAEGPHRLKTYAQLRFDQDMSSLRTVLLHAGYHRRVASRWTLGGAYTHLNNRLPAGGRRTDHRYELESTFTRPWESGRLQWRNRLEYVDRGEAMPHQVRARSRLGYRHPLTNFGPLTHAGFDNEFIYDLRHGRLLSNRFVPMRLSLRLGDEVRYSAYFMIVSRRAGLGWRQLGVLGSTVAF
jgi:hypothetical protein